MPTTLRERLSEDMKAAMRAREDLRLSTIRMARAEILTKDKERGEEATEEEILKILQSMVKRREEAAEQFEKGGREDMARKERDEIAFIRAYLPAQMSEEELASAAAEAIAEAGASTMKDMGKVMGILTKRLAGRATGARISQTVKQLLSG